MNTASEQPSTLPNQLKSMTRIAFCIIQKLLKI